MAHKQMFGYKTLWGIQYILAEHFYDLIMAKTNAFSICTHGEFWRFFSACDFFFNIFYVNSDFKSFLMRSHCLLTEFISYLKQLETTPDFWICQEIVLAFFFWFRISQILYSKELYFLSTIFPSIFGWREYKM